MLRSLRFVSILLFGLSATLPLLHAEDAPLAAIPNDADVVIRMKAPQTTIDKTAEMAAQVQQRLADQVRRYADGLGLYISNPTLAGVDRSRDWHVVVFAHSDADPDVVYIIPARDPDAMQDALADEISSFARGDWVFYCEQSAVIERLQGLSGNADPGILSELSEDARAIFDRSDLSLFVNVDHLNEVYAEQIEARRTEYADRVTRRLGMLALVPGMDPAALVGGGSDAMGRAVQDSTAFTAGLVIDNSGVNLETYCEFTDGSATSEAVSELPRAPMESLSDLPDEALFYIGLAGRLARKADWGLSTFSSAVPLDEEKPEEFQDLKEAFDAVQYDSMVGALGVGDSETGYIRFVSIIDASSTDSLRDAKQQVSELLDAEDPDQGLKQTAEYEADAETYGEHKVDLLTIRQEIDPNINPFFAQIMGNLQRVLYGPDGIQVRLLFDDGRYLQSTGGGEQAMQQAVEQFTNEDENGLPDARHGLIDDPSILLLIDVQRAVRLALQALAESNALALPIDPAMLEGEEPEPSYVGISLASEPDALRSKTHIPPVQLVRIIQVGVFLRMLQQQPQP